MLLKSIKYYNFRPFIGNQEIILERNPERPDANVVVILGDNTFGKSTFVLSFIWCLYGESRFTRPNDILNKKIESKLKAGDEEGKKASVEIQFEDDGKEYFLKREQKFVKNEKGIISTNGSIASLSYTSENGEIKKIGQHDMQHDINTTIQSILPVELSNFFFFEGENNNEIKKKDLGKAVRTLLGLEVYDNMRRHMFGSQNQNTPSKSSVMGDYLERQKDESGERAKEQYDEMINAEEEYNDCKKNIEEIDKQIQEYEEKIERINEQLRRAEPSKKLQERRDQIATEVEKKLKLQSKRNKDLIKIFNQDVISLLATPFLDDATEKLEKMNVSNKGISGIEARAIYELLNRGECLCGAKLEKESAAYKNVEQYIEYVPPKDVGSLVRDVEDSIYQASEKNKDFVKTFEEIYKEICSIRTDVNLLDGEDREKLAEISKITMVDTENAEENLHDYKERKRKLGENKEKIIERKTQSKIRMDDAKREFDKLKSKSDRAKQYEIYYTYANKIYCWVNENYSKKEKNLRQRLNNYIQQLFSDMYSGKREIEIDEKYNIYMTVDGSIVDDTGGLRVIQYFAYVGGLVKLAYEILQEREIDEDGNQESLGEQYPLVLDAAFSHADDTHTKNIARELAGAASQLIFAIMKKDWEYAKQGIEGSVGRIYELNKIDETEVQIVEVNLNGSRNS